MRSATQESESVLISLSCVFCHPLNCPHARAASNLPIQLHFPLSNNMCLSMRCLPILFLIATTLGLTVPLANPAIYLPSQSLSIINTSNIIPPTSSALNSSCGSDTEYPLHLDNNAQLLNNTIGKPRCDGTLYGYDLNIDSCLNAWAKIPIDDDFVTYGARNHGHFEAPLPVRHLSCKSQLYTSLSLFWYRPGILTLDL